MEEHPSSKEQKQPDNPNPELMDTEAAAPSPQATDTASASSSNNNWSWGSFLQKATTDIIGKSTAMVEFMKRDLTEFSEVMQKDTAIIMNDATQSLKGKMTMEEASKAAGLVKSGITSFFGSINSSLAMFEEKPASDSAHEQQTRFQTRLSTIQHDPNTYQKEPSGRPEDFEAWLLMFDINKKRADMENILDTADCVQNAYNQFVPLVVTHNEFWQRYFYRVYQLEKDEKRIQSLMARSGDERTPDDMDWGDEDPGAASPSTYLDPSEVCSVVSNESFQMVSHDPVVEHDVGDAILVDSASHPDSPVKPISGHKKQGLS